MTESATRPAPSVWWMILPFAAELTLTAALLALVGTDDNGVDVGLLATARLAYGFFLLAYIGGALATLFGPAFDGLRQHGREFGLAFAAALSVHLALVTWICLLGDLPPVSTFVVFGIAALCVYGLALFSVARLQQWIGRRAWTGFRFLAMNYIACVFADDFLRVAPTLTIDYLLDYLPFALLAMASPALYFAALVKRRAPRLALR
ncbi:MAG TPA: hypothetical protein VG328_22050 [Stellaceae bacterium]|nr:hypothetical protein [Stellaceae bacterium]